MELEIVKYPSRETWGKLFERPTFDVTSLFDTVRDIMSKVRAEGDQAVKTFTEKFDGVSVSDLKVSEEEINRAEKMLSGELKKAMQQAAANIETFHISQKDETVLIETMPGVRCWRKSIPIEKVGLYIPGGTAPLFSSVLMLGIPARLAGCREVVLCTPPDKSGNIHPAILYAARLTGISSIFKAGGAQAVAALTYGTESIPSVDKIFGPGNQYVTAAKQLASIQGTAIDMPAGPSEVAVVADQSADASFIAADLLSQAEHGRDSQVVLFTTDESLVEKVNKELILQLESLPRKELALESLSNSKVILARNIEEAMEMCNAYAPEHLILAVEDGTSVADMVINAGSVFVGHFTPESAGDYASGTNHTLPTNGAARAYSGVSLDSFVKKVTFQSISGEGIERLGDTIELMASAEELEGHRNAVKIRRDKLNQQ